MPDEFATTDPSGAADEVVVGEPAGVGVELATALEGDGVQPALRVGQLDPVADLERPAPGVPVPVPVPVRLRRRSVVHIVSRDHER